MRVKYLIIGAGPTGLGAANRLRELGEDSFLILEKNDYVGGLAASFTDKAGFTWDVGGHVVFSHYPYFDRLVDDLMAGEVLKHERESWIRSSGTWVPYPFQNNLRYLPKDLVWECVRGLMEVYGKQHKAPPADFREWIGRVFGPGIAKVFMLPYNFKVWAFPPETMSHKWIGERVSVIDLERAMRNIILERDDVAWGPNNTFSFPLRGGTGEIYRRLGARFADRILAGRGASAVDPKIKTVRTVTGEIFEYEELLNTGPLDLLAGELVADAPDAVRDAAKKLKHSGSLIGGVGVDGVRNDPKCWMYFPETNCPFYRVTNFHIYSPNNTPNPDGMRARQRAFMTEASYSPYKVEDAASHMDRVVGGLVNASLMTPEDPARITSTWEMRVEYSYPIPCLERDAALSVIQPWLEEAGIFSRGRFGGWKYETGNMDHSLMQGVEWAERMVQGKAETVYSY